MRIQKLSVGMTESGAEPSAAPDGGLAAKLNTCALLFSVCTCNVLNMRKSVIATVII